MAAAGAAGDGLAVVGGRGRREAATGMTPVDEVTRQATARSVPIAAGFRRQCVLAISPHR